MLIPFSRRRLLVCAIWTLLLPVILFLLTFLRPLFGIPAALLALAAGLLYSKGRVAAPLETAFGKGEDTLALSLPALVAMILCALVWTMLSGIGGFFYQNDDFYGRNAIFHDLLEHPWPVYFPGTSHALTYYIGFWIVPGLIGRSAGALIGPGIVWDVANTALALQTVWFLLLCFLLVASLTGITRLAGTCGMLLVFVLFSGMDGLVCFLRGDWTDQIEWWAQLWQYSSNTTCLFWVFNQAVPAWLATCMLLHETGRVKVWALIGLSTLLYSPLPLVGMVALCVLVFLVRLAAALRQGRAGSLLCAPFSACNLLAVAFSLPILLYLSANHSSSDAPFRLDLYLHAYTLPEALSALLVFCLVEWLALALLLLPRYFRDPVFASTLLILLGVPMFKVGYHMDFSMRASIPGLLTLMCYTLHTLCDARTRLPVRLLVVLVLLVGSITPMKEFERGAYRVMKAGTFRMFSDPFKTVLHPQADTANFICEDTGQELFYQLLARPRDTGS